MIAFFVHTVKKETNITLNTNVQNTADSAVIQVALLLGTIKFYLVHNLRTLIQRTTLIRPGLVKRKSAPDRKSE